MPAGHVCAKSFGLFFFFWRVLLLTRIWRCAGAQYWLSLAARDQKEPPRPSLAAGRNLRGLRSHAVSFMGGLRGVVELQCCREVGSGAVESQCQRV